MHVTETVVLPVTFDATSVVPGTAAPKLRVEALIVQEAVIVICTVSVAVAVPACAVAKQQSERSNVALKKAIRQICLSITISQEPRIEA